MLRRTFLWLMAIAPAVRALSAPTALAPTVERRYGRQTWRSVRRDGYWPARVLLDGVDVSDDAAECDDVVGYVVVFDKREDGRRYVNPVTGAFVKRTLRGHVQFLPKGTYAPRDCLHLSV